LTAARTRTGLVVRVLVLSCALAGCQAATGSEQDQSASPSTAIEAESFEPVRDYPQVALPVRLRIPAARVNTELLRLGRMSDGTIAIPPEDSFDLAGWYEEGPRPGQPGPAVIVGHVDSKKDGPAVFFDLKKLPMGSLVHVDRADGSTVTFRVTGRSQVPKTLFPTDLVYGATLEPSLRLVTCGGVFDRHARSYLDNVIVYAVPA
jgi:hypothetical protein